MMNPTLARMWGTGLWLFNPGYLIDRLLDQLETVSKTMMPAQADTLSCAETGVETRLDQFGA